MKLSIKRIFLKALKVTGIVLGSLLLLMFLLPYLFPQAINRKINAWANSNINGNISFTHTGLSFFKKFPALTLTLYDVTLKGSAPFEKDTLIAAKEISLGIDLSSIFKSKITIRKILLNEAFINIQVDSAGNANYNIYKQKQENKTAETDTGGASLGINKIKIENSRLVYNDRSLPMLINASGFNYLGSGDLSKDIFELNTHTEIKSLDFYFNNQAYMAAEKINADLVTEVNTRSLAFIFVKNNININELPVEFNGRFGFLKDGYDMDFNIDSHENNISEIITALPSAYQKLFDKTNISGTGNMQIALKGKFIAKDSIKPDLTMSIKVRNGYIGNNKTPFPIRNLYLDMESKLRGLNEDSSSLAIDSLYFNLGDGYFSSVFRMKGVKEPEIYARVNSEIDLEKWDHALGLKPFNIKGKFSLHLLAEGRYATCIERKGLRHKVDTVITSIPKFTLRSSFRDGYFKYSSLPEAVKNISFSLRADCADNDYKHISLSVDSLNATALDNYIKGYFTLSNAADFPVSAGLHASFHLDELKQFYPLDSIDLKGDLNADIQAKGNYVPGKKEYPVLAANISLKNGSVKTRYYPHPIEDIQIQTIITDKTGSLKGLNVSLQPVSFTFEQEPFLIKADLQDFTDLKYNVSLKGDLNIGNIYQVFAQKSYQITGDIAADLSLNGKQSDIKAGRYGQLSNRGKLKIKNIYCTTDIYPKPFVIGTGVFSFNQDKMRFDTFVVKYANSAIVLNGEVSNVIDYIMKPGSPLKGELDLSSDLLVADDFMAFSDTAQTVNAAVGQPQNSNASGVIMVPKNLDVKFTAAVKTIKYKDMVIKDAKGQMMIKGDSIVLKETGFSLIGAPITMDATYTSISTQKATFDYHISAKDFDIKKAYNGIKLFHDMASSAAHAEGLVSLDYHLKGKLNSGMLPVYASLKGGGVLSAKKLSMHGFKLFNAIGQKANKDSLGGNSDVAQVDIKTTIADNIITVERTKMRVAGFRARFEGQVSFDKAIDLKFRLGLPPLGIIGIPMNITGTEDNPKIKVGKDNKGNELVGTKDDTDD